MTVEARPLFAQLPTLTGWDFGGFCYGLEPLTLPDVGEADLPPRHDSDPAETYLQTCRRLHLMCDDDTAVTGVECCQTPEELFWFRWITGHQVCFVIWRLMAQVTDDVTGGRLAPGTAVASLCHYIRGYCAMLLYTGSCPRGIYHSLIRPSMRLRHRSFSGSWAPDYWPVRDLFRARPSPLAWCADHTELRRALKLHQFVHDGVAARLVPDGRSLLRQSGARAQDVRLLNTIYDNYFMTLRAPVTRHDIIAQLLRRLVAISQDVAVNSLHPDGMTDLDEQPLELTTPEVLGCEGGFTEILWQVAASACGAYAYPDASGEAPTPTPVGTPSSV